MTNEDEFIQQLLHYNQYISSKQAAKCLKYYPFYGFYYTKEA